MIIISVFSVNADANIHADFLSNPVNYMKLLITILYHTVGFFIYFDILYAYSHFAGCGKNIAIRSSGRHVLVCNMRI